MFMEITAKLKKIQSSRHVAHGQINRNTYASYKAHTKNQKLSYNWPDRKSWKRRTKVQTIWVDPIDK